MARIIASLMVASAVLLVSVVRADDPEFCRRPVPFPCLTPLFKPEVLAQVSALRDINLVALTRMEDVDLAKQLNILDAFCGPFIASTKCGRANNWYECSRDIEAVTGLVNSVQQMLVGTLDWALSADKIQTFMRYAGLMCSESAGLRDVLRNKTCIVDSMANASEHFRVVQVNRLSKILSENTTFDGKCAQAQGAVFDLMEVVDDGCPEPIADSMFRFLASAFTIVPKYSASACPINRTRPDDFDEDDFDMDMETSTAVAGATTPEPEPEWCSPRTSTRKYRCFADSISSTILTKVRTFEDINPIGLLTMSEGERARRLQTIDSFCDFLDPTIACANKWWECKADLRTVAGFIDDLQEITGRQKVEIDHNWLKRHLKFGSLLCADDSLDLLVNNHTCVDTGMKAAGDAVNRLGEILASRRFEASKCEQAKTDFKAVATAINNSCEENLANFTENLLQAAFILLEDYSDLTCSFLEHL